MKSVSSDQHRIYEYKTHNHMCSRLVMINPRRTRRPETQETVIHLGILGILSAESTSLSLPDVSRKQLGPPIEMKEPSNSGGPSMPMVHHYINPTTNEHITSLLPPDHPEMVCLQAGSHLRRSEFGFLGKPQSELCVTLLIAIGTGVLAAIVWFPLGIGLCLLDRRVKCRRCGAILDGGISC